MNQKIRRFLWIFVIVGLQLSCGDDNPDTSLTPDDFALKSIYKNEQLAYEITYADNLVDKISYFNFNGELVTRYGVYYNADNQVKEAKLEYSNATVLFSDDNYVFNYDSDGVLQLVQRTNKTIQFPYTGSEGRIHFEYSSVGKLEGVFDTLYRVTNLDERIIRTVDNKLFDEAGNIVSEYYFFEDLASESSFERCNENYSYDTKPTPYRALPLNILLNKFGENNVSFFESRYNCEDVVSVVETVLEYDEYDNLIKETTNGYVTEYVYEQIE